MNFISLFFAIIAGGLGAALRYASTVILPAKKDSFPLAVFVVNAVGSLLVGLFTALLANSVLSPEVSFVFVAGFCGGLTTMATGWLPVSTLSAALRLDFWLWALDTFLVAVRSAKELKASVRLSLRFFLMVIR
jgi:protein CrcB